MKLHRSTTEAVVHALTMIFAEAKYADKVIEKVLKSNHKWGARDRRFIAETTYDIVRWYRWLLEIGEGTPNDFWTLIAAYFRLRGVQLPGWSEFRHVDPEKIIRRKRQIEGIRKIEQSIPDWLDDLGVKELGEWWDREIKALNEEAKVVLRANTLKSMRDDLSQNLANEKVVTYTLPAFPDALILSERQNIFKLSAFQSGLFEVQDAASQLIAPFLQVEPGMRVIDACAGAGGKTLHLACLMKNKGRLIAMDVEQWKLDELQKRARRAGATNLETRLIDSTKTVKRLAKSADRLLLDVPCSGLGVLKRNPDAKWKLSEDFVNEVRNQQQKIMDEYSSMLKPGGILVYATCSILPSENEKQVQRFLQSNDSFEFIEEKHVWPSEGFDGFYMARLKRKD